MSKNTNTLARIVFITLSILIVLILLYVASTWIFLKIYNLNYAPNPVYLFKYYAAYVDNPKSPKQLVNALKGFVFIPPILVLLAGLFIALKGKKKQSLHGEARFAKLYEIIKDGLIKKPSDADKTAALSLQNKIDQQNQLENRNFNLGKHYKGFVLPPKSLLLGKFNGKFLTFEGFQFAFLSAPTRSGKGVGIVIPNLLSYPESMVVLDIKYENYDITSGFREKCLGQEVFRFSPFDEKGATHRYNPLSYISDGAKRITDIDAIGAALYRAAPGEKDPFWKDNAKQLFRGIALLVIENPHFTTSLGQINRIASGMGHEGGLKGWILEQLQDGYLNANNERVEYSLACKSVLQKVFNSPEATLGGIVTSFTTPLSAWDNPYVDNATSYDDFDLRDVRKKGMTIYVGVQPKYLSQASTILNIFFDQLISENTVTLPKEDPTLTHQCVLLMDEFTALGRVQSMSDAIGFMAGYNMRPFIIIQNREQLEDCYGKEQAKTMLSNFAAMVMYPPSALNTDEAQKCSEMLGYTTFKSESKGRSNPAGFGNGSSSQSSNISDQRRALMLPQEILEMAPTEEIVKVNNSKPIFAEKIRYYLDKDFTCRANMSKTEIKDLDVNAFTESINQKTYEIQVKQVENKASLAAGLADLYIQKNLANKSNTKTDDQIKEEVSSAEEVKSSEDDLGFTNLFADSFNNTENKEVDLTPIDEKSTAKTTEEAIEMATSSKTDDEVIEEKLSQEQTNKTKPQSPAQLDEQITDSTNSDSYQQFEDQNTDFNNLTNKE